MCSTVVDEGPDEPMCLLPFFRHLSIKDNTDNVIYTKLLVGYSFTRIIVESKRTHLSHANGKRADKV